MPVDPARIRLCFETARDALLAERNGAGHWVGELSASALSTATAVMALELVRRQRESSPAFAKSRASELQSLIEDGIRWLAEHQNEDGGWGDTTKSISNISTSMLCRASFHATGNDETHATVVRKAAAYINDAGGVPAVLKRYGKDRTFSIPILTHCALAGLVNWKDVLPLPFYLACLPPKFYKTVRLPVVSYALPALIAIGQVGYHFRKPWNPISRLLKWLAIGPSLKRLGTIQPADGGFLEATPLTGFVTMSLAGMGRADHPVAQKGAQFLIDSVRPDGSWPIDTNLATWVTTLSVNALGDDLPEDGRPAIRDWLLDQQFKELHPYTSAAPGGWAWTDLPGGVPDADDTPGAMLALMELQESGVRSPESGIPSQADGLPSNEALNEALEDAIRWLLRVQNRDGGFPTFCRGWGTLPFDRSSSDITAHCLRGLTGWLRQTTGITPQDGIAPRFSDAPPGTWYAIQSVNRGFRFLDRAQRLDGSWLPLWFGNQHAPNDVNPLYGTAKVLAAYRDCDRIGTSSAQRGLEWLRANQNGDGGWGGVKGVRSSVEETALAVEILASAEPQADSTRRGLQWLCDCVEDGTWRETTPIGFYFARLWYFERLYPLIFVVAALRRALQTVGHPPETRSQQTHQIPT
ncbi:MAG: prenyltransferase/squalene oxidase repeat-containing protein [Planctomycetaceae bacterium]